MNESVDSFLEDFHIIGSPDSTEFQLRQVGELKEGYELTTSFTLRRVGGSGALDIKTLTSLLVRAASNGQYTDLLQKAAQGLQALKKTYYPRHQEELDLLICFISKYTGSIGPKFRTLDSIRGQVVVLLREEGARTRVLNELGLFMSTYTEVTALMRNPESFGVPFKIQTKILILQQSMERMETLIPELPTRDLEEFRELYTSSRFLLHELQEKTQSLRTHPVIHIRIPGVSTPLVVHPGERSDDGEK